MFSLGLQGRGVALSHPVRVGCLAPEVFAVQPLPCGFPWHTQRAANTEGAGRVPPAWIADRPALSFSPPATFVGSDVSYARHDDESTSHQAAFFETADKRG